MTYTESIKSGHIAVWIEKGGVVLTSDELAYEYQNMPINIIENLNIHADIYAVNAINQMIDSARDL
tara:strand:- start:739 stop:936 length:198 start_codon:yes stop_codon:yes gene_type:complete